MDRLTSFGLFAVAAMLVTYALESRSRWFILAFAGCVRPRFGLRFPAGRLAVWIGGSGLVLRRPSPLVASPNRELRCPPGVNFPLLHSEFNSQPQRLYSSPPHYPIPRRGVPVPARSPAGPSPRET